MTDSDYDEYQLLLTDTLGRVRHGILNLADLGEYKCRLVLSFDGRTVEAMASDFFEAFCQIRLQLEPEGILPVCYAASKNVYPSGMCRDMGAGLKAYKMTIGQRARMADLIDVFDSDEEVSPATLAEQRAFFETWLKSFQN